MTERVSKTLENFTTWLDRFGETSWDHQSFFAGPVGRLAKSLYYNNRLFGTGAVAPMIFSEAFLPSGRRLFHQRTRFPIADAHFAMGFAFLYEANGDPKHLDRAIHFLDELKVSRCPQFKEYCWGYPFDWVTRDGTIQAQTPLITTTPYVYEAFLHVLRILEGMRPSPGSRAPSLVRPNLRGCAAVGGWERDGLGHIPSTLNHQQSTVSGAAPSPLIPLPSNGRGEHPVTSIRYPASLELSTLNSQLSTILSSIARHAANDIKDFRVSETASSCSYTPYDSGGVINAAAYRAFLLTSASHVFGLEEYWKIAERNLNFVLENQNADGSWFYAVDGVRDFVDHFHTCFVLKALAKIHSLIGHEGCLQALEKGVRYYQANLFDVDGLPRPFSRAPRLTVYKRELYDCAECINLCLLLRDRFPMLNSTLDTVLSGILNHWIKPDGSFRSRRLHFGWDNVPMHRWAQSQMFRALAFYLREEARRDRLQRSQREDPSSKLQAPAKPQEPNSKPHYAVERELTEQAEVSSTDVVTANQH